MRINIVSGPFYPSPPAPTGAVQRIWFDLAKVFVARGHEVRIQSCKFPGYPDHQDVDGIEITRVIGLNHTRRTPINLLKDLVYSLRVLVMLPAADVTVTNCFWLPAVMTRFPGRKRWGKVYVCFQRVPKGQVKLYLKCDRLHGVSSAISRWIVEEEPRAEVLTRTIPNPIDVRFFNAAPGLAPQPATSHRTILFTGRVHPEKGLDILLRALPYVLEQVSNVRLRIVGPTTPERGGGGEAYLASLHELAKGLPVQFDEPIYDRAVLADVLRSADVYCYPSIAEKGEASPVAPLEAMGVGLVPVCSDLPQFRDYLHEGENGVIFNHRGPDAPRNLADALIALLKEPQRLRQMAEAAARTAAGFSNEAIADQFLQDFESLLSARSRNGGGQ